MTRRAKPGRTGGLGPPEGQPWVWFTSTMLASNSFRALSLPARRVLDFLMFEHASHGGRENGNLAAPYRQLTVWGCTQDDVRKGLDELHVLGFVTTTKQGHRQAGGGEPSRYALTWVTVFPGTADEAPPTNLWLHVSHKLHREGVANVRAVRGWLKGQLSKPSRASRAPRTQSVTPHLRVV